MRIRIEPGPLEGRVEQVIASKSVIHRALICAAQAEEPTVLEGMASSADTEATCRCLRALGAETEQEKDCLRVIPGKLPEGERLLDCGESGSTLRFLLPVAAAMGAEAAFTGRGKLAQRPLSPLYEEMQAHGAVLSPQGSFPLQCSGQLRSGRYTLAGNVSSQFFSGLIMALPRLPGDSEIRIAGRLESEPYVRMTEETLERFGIRTERTEDRILIPGGQKYRSPGRLRIEGDWSGAAFWLAAGALSDAGVACGGLNLSSAQGDRAAAEILEAFGAQVTRGPEDMLVKRGRLRGITLDTADIPDLVPVLAVVAAYAEGETRIRHIARLRLKESDRVASVLALLQSLGGQAEAREDEMIIRGTGGLRGGTVNVFGDHRIAMAAAVAAARTETAVTIPGAEAVNKSYPGFFDVFRALGGRADEEEEKQDAV